MTHCKPITSFPPKPRPRGGGQADAHNDDAPAASWLTYTGVELVHHPAPGDDLCPPGGPALGPSVEEETAAPAVGGPPPFLAELAAGAAMLLIAAVSFISLLGQLTTMRLHSLSYSRAVALAKNTLQNSASVDYDDLLGLAASNRVNARGVASPTGEFLRVVTVDPGYGGAMNPSAELTRINVAVACLVGENFRNPASFAAVRWPE